MSVLSTLQPDQYRMVTWPDDRLLVVQGQPGTGKTIIATHRAAFLTHPEREGRPPLKRTLIVGPTDQYRSHVVGALDDLGAMGTLVQSVPSLMRALVGITQKQEPEQDRRLDTSWALGRVVDKAARDLLRARRFAGRAEQDLKTLVNELVADTKGHRSVIGNTAERDELSAWLLALKSFDNAARHAHALPFLACAALATRNLRRSDTFDHIVVDEAQDVRPLEWRILLRLLDDAGPMKHRCHETTVREAMTAPVVSVRPQARFGDLVTAFRSHPGRSMPVVDEDGRLRGLLLRKDFLGAFEWGDLL